MSDEDYELRWPKPLLHDELGALVEQDITTPWRDRIEVILFDAFVASTAAADFAALPPPANDPWAPQTPDPWAQPSKPSVAPERQFVRDLLARLDGAAYEGNHTPYYSQRVMGAAVSRLDLHGVATGIRSLALNLNERGYFERAFGKDCPDAPSSQSPEDVLEIRLGRRLPWLPPAYDLAADQADLFDLIEVLHDLAAFPRSRRFHGWDDCGWHHSDFIVGPGRAVYRWAVNRILDRSDLGLRLAGEGEDRGRLVAATDPDREQLTKQMASRDDPATGDRVRHAVSLFRSRLASEHDKRSACIALAGVLEERRNLLKAELLSKDEGAMFQIANSFAIRHQGAQQQGDYDPAFLDWVYWFYLSTIELSDRLIARKATA